MGRGVQEQELERVSTRIATSIVEFCSGRVGDLFHMEELVSFVTSKIPYTAPDSASRILRDLRAKGRVSYTVVSRSGSLYKVESVLKED